MAAHGNDLQHTGGDMDISAHQKTWKGFTKFVKISAGLIVLLMIFLALFRTH